LRNSTKGQYESERDYKIQRLKEGGSRLVAILERSTRGRVDVLLRADWHIGAIVRETGKLRLDGLR